MKNVEISLLSPEDVWGEDKLDVLKEYGTSFSCTDLAQELYTGKEPLIIHTSGTEIQGNPYYSDYLMGVSILPNGEKEFTHYDLDGAILPVITSEELFKQLFPKAVWKGYYEVEFGEYPQEKVSSVEQRQLDNKLSLNQLHKTGRRYYITEEWEGGWNTDWSATRIAYDEYEYNGKKYICIPEEKSNPKRVGYYVSNKKNRWFEVKPIKWLVDEKRKCFVCEKALLSNIKYYAPKINEKYARTIKYSNTAIYHFITRCMLKDIMQTVSLEEDKSLSSEPARNYSKYPKEVQEKINEIIKVCSKLPDDVKSSIMMEVDKLLIEYDKDVEQTKPMFNPKHELIIELKNVKFLQTNLITELDMIIISLTSEEKAIKFLSKLSDYKKLLSTNPKDLIKGDDSLDSKINNIIFMINEISNSKKELFRNDLIKYISNAIKEVSKELERGIDNKPDISIKEWFGADKKLELNISKLYDDVSFYYDKVIPYEKIIKAFETDSNNDSEIGKMILDIKKIISEFPNKEYKEELETKFNDIKTNYISMINNIIGNDELIKNTKYEKIENNLRKELQELLLLIKKYNILELCKPKNYSKNNLIKELQDSKQIILGNKVVEITNEIELQSITSTIIDINNHLINSVIDNDTKKEIKHDLVSIIDKKELELEKTDINNPKEYMEELKKILSDIMGIKIEINNYIANMKEWKEYTR
ncbi:MAG: hypothetical protein VZS44_01310 [Bacilli bacterium]|nr:hypothetical protein [Bacilli bacterium]